MLKNTFSLRGLFAPPYPTSFVDLLYMHAELYNRYELRLQDYIYVLDCVALICSYLLSTVDDIHRVLIDVISKKLMERIRTQSLTLVMSCFSRAKIESSDDRL